MKIAPDIWLAGYPAFFCVQPDIWYPANEVVGCQEINIVANTKLKRKELYINNTKIRKLDGYPESGKITCRISD